MLQQVQANGERMLCGSQRIFRQLFPSLVCNFPRSVQSKTAIMPKNKGKGGKNYKKGKKGGDGETRRDLLFKEDGQEYAQVLRMLGDGRLALQCYDDVARVGLIRGTMRRRVWINTGDIVLIGLREFQPEKADVIHKYSTEEARNLQAFGELPTSARINQTAVDMAMEGGEEGEDMGFDFEDI